MIIKQPNHLPVAIASIAVTTLACSLLTKAVPTATPTQAPPVLATTIPSQVVAETPTNPPLPTPVDTSIPLPTPDVTPTQDLSQVLGDVEDYYTRGYLPFENGQLYHLGDFSKTKPSINVFDFTRAGQQAQDFALWADIEMDSTGYPSYPDYSGCGFAYRVQNDNEGYTAILTNEAVRMGYCEGGLHQYELFGTTHGTGKVDLGNPSKALFSLAVNKDRAFVLVNGVLVGQYTLFTSRLLGMGDVYYSVVSNINAGYWSSCKMSNIILWESYP